MRWLCWFAPHKWIASIAPEVEQCERCPKLRPKPAARELPRGTRPCPYPDCSGWCAPPQLEYLKNGITYSIIHRTWECQDCKRSIRWERGRLSSEWPANMPIAVEGHNEA